MILSDESENGFSVHRSECLSSVNLELKAWWIPRSYIGSLKKLVLISVKGHLTNRADECARGNEERQVGKKQVFVLHFLLYWLPPESVTNI